MLVFEYVIFISRIADVDQVVRNRFSIYCIVGQVLSSPDINWAASAAANVVLPDAVGPKTVIS